jgi:cation transport regulator ChaC
MQTFSPLYEGAACRCYREHATTMTIGTLNGRGLKVDRRPDGHARNYFAYGSNMHRAHMAKLCPQAEALGPAHLNHHRFFVAAGGYGSIAPMRGARVHGVLWRISARDRVALDRYESVATDLYRPGLLPVHWNGKLLRALVYVASDARPGRPSAEYRTLVLGAARDWALPDGYIRVLEGGMALFP